MVLLIVVAFIAGLVTAVSPCVLPILPIVLATGADGDRRRPYLVIAGLIASFAFFTLASVQIISALNLPSSTLRDIAIAIIAVFGLTLLVPALNRIFERATSRLPALGSRFVGGAGSASGGTMALPDLRAGRSEAAGETTAVRPRASIVGGLVTGVGLGLVWTPCAGPILGAITSLAVTTPGSLSTLVLVVSYAIGAGLPLLAIALGGRAALSRLRLRSASGWASRAFGALVLVTAGLMAVGADTALSADLTNSLPNWTNTLQTIERSGPVQSALGQLQGGQTTQQPGIDTPTQQPAAAADLPNLGTAPDFTGIDHWLNSQPLTMASLRGKVVLVDFWTYSCINCIRTLPYVEGWYQKYAAEGFVVVGVHSPEFAFEHDTGNVQDAINRFGITYPVAQDNEFHTWSAYNNEYWPADYLIDANGQIRDEHFGEGDYAQTEQKIRLLLEAAGEAALPTPSASSAAVPIAGGQTPETYLGLERGQSFIGDPQSGPHSYSLPELLPDNEFALSGSFDFQPQYVQSASAGGKLEFSFQAKDVYLVMSADTPVTANVSVSGAADGTVLPTEDVAADGSTTVSTARLYHLVHLSSSQRAVVTITFEQAGARAFAFTFGS
jgi:cytochrome c biogenesis protein CcdA/thiol-disulfide isomerase/thioredoxin